MFLNLLFTPKGEENAIICRKSHFSPLSPACAHLLIIFKCNHLPFCFQNHWDFTPFRAELGGKGLALNISQCLKVWNVITRQMKDCVFSCCHVGFGELSTSMDCLFLCAEATRLGWGSQCFMSPTHISSYKPLCDEHRRFQWRLEWRRWGQLWDSVQATPTVTPEWGHCALHKLLFSSDWFHIFSFIVWFLT